MYFQENNKLFGLKGILNRRGFITNLFTVFAFNSVVFETPVMWYFIFHPNKFMDVYLNNAAASGWMLFISFLSLISLWILIFPSILRRMRDIVGQENDNKIYLHCAIVYGIVIFCLLYPSVMVKSITYSILVIFMCLEGAISGQRPANPVLKFNWGAFIGVWLWGILNKLPKTLLTVPLMFTPAWFYIQMIFGLKGNEWSYKSTSPRTDEEFHTNQVNQAMLMGTVVPIIFVIVSMVLFSYLMPMLKSMVHNSPDLYKKLSSTLVQAQSVQAKDDFSQITFENGEYKFYIDPKIWTSLSDNAKISKFNNAAAYVMTQKKESVNDIDNMPVQGDILSKIKIYSNYNNELLGEFSLDKESLADVYSKFVQDKDIKGMSEFIRKGFRFNDHPALP